MKEVGGIAASGGGTAAVVAPPAPAEAPAEAPAVRVARVAFFIDAITWLKDAFQVSSSLKNARNGGCIVATSVQNHAHHTNQEQESNRAGGQETRQQGTNKHKQTTQHARETKQ